MRRRLNIKDFGAKSGGKALCTRAIQKAIEEAGKWGGEVYIPKGIFLTGALFLKSNMSLYLEEEAILTGTTQEEEYPVMPDRIAGIEMEWPVGILNIRNAENVKIHGVGKIDGQGFYWWQKYWGKDKHGGMRQEYEQQGLRWAVDYDCRRVRNVVVFNSRNVVLEGFDCCCSGFWNIHICYSQAITVSGVRIYDNQGPSTDGIDIDSSSQVLVEDCIISCNDDNICVKAGRDADGLRVGRKSENIVIRNCRLLEGEGITLGSETSGGICGISVRDCTFTGTRNGFRLKSARNRGGIIENVTVQGLNMTDVACVFSFEGNWNPTYSYGEIPVDYKDKIPEHWHILTKKVVREEGIPRIKNIKIERVKAVLSEKYSGVSQAFFLQGLEEAPFENLDFLQVEIWAHSFGNISCVKNLRLQQVKINICL